MRTRARGHEPLPYYEWYLRHHCANSVQDGDYVSEGLLRSLLDEHWLAIRERRLPAVPVLDLLTVTAPEELFPKWRQLTEELVGVASLASVDLSGDVLSYLDELRSVFEEALRANS